MVDPIAAILEALPRIRTRVLDDTTILRRTTILTASMDTSAMVDPIAAILEAMPRIRTKPQTPPHLPRTSHLHLPMFHLAQATCGSQALSRRATLCHIRPTTPACPPHPAPTRTFGSSTNTIRYGRLYWDQKAQCSAQQNGSGSITGREGALPDPLIGPYDGWVDGVYCLEMGGLERLGIDCDAYARANLGLATTDMRLSYKAPLRSKDKFRVLSGVSRVTGARAVMDEVILKSVTNGDGEEKDMVIAKCQVTLVVLDGGYKVTRLPAAIKDVFTTLVQEAISITEEYSEHWMF
eukprot:gene26619-4243_t